jgi:hypothetical protein
VLFLRDKIVRQIEQLFVSGLDGDDVAIDPNRHSQRLVVQKRRHAALKFIRMIALVQTGRKFQQQFLLFEMFSARVAQSEIHDEARDARKTALQALQQHRAHEKIWSLAPVTNVKERSF